MKRIVTFAASLVLSIAPVFAQVGVGPPIGPVNGSGGGGAGGTVTSVATSCGLTGGPITTSGTVQTTLPPNAQTGTTFTPTAASNCGQSVTLTNASAIAVSLVAANWTTTSNYFNAYVKNTSTGSATFTPTTGTIDGLASETFAPGTGATFIFDGTNWTTSGRYVNGPTSATANDCAKFSDATGQHLADAGACGGFQTVAGYKSSNWYTTLYGTNFAASSAPPTTSAVYCHPFIVSSQGLTVKGIGTANSTTGAGYASYAIYKGDGTGGRPGTLIDTVSASVADSATAPTAITGTLTNTTDALTSGMNWVCASFSDTTVRYISPVSTGGNLFNSLVGSANVTGNPGLLSTSTGSNGITCTAGTSCGSGFAVWSGSTFSWASLSSATWAETASSVMPYIVLQAN